MIVGIHQSQYLPWPPYFRKIEKSDIFVILDDVQFQKNGMQNRNKIRNRGSDFWLTVPVTGGIDCSIKKKKIADKKWRKKHFQSIQQSYSKSEYWENYKDHIEEIYNKESEYINQINTELIYFFTNSLNIDTKIIFSSEINAGGSKSDFILNICKELGANTYISGNGGKDYLDINDFNRHNVDIDFLESKSPQYDQFHGEFIPNLSMLDMIMNVSKIDIVNHYLSGELV